MKKILSLLLVGILLGCSSTPYKKVVVKGYRVSKADNRFMSKKGKELSYYKYNDKDAAIFMVIEKNEETQEVIPLLNLEYKGEDWLYMEKVKFVSGSKDLEIDFIRHKFSGALSEEDPKTSGNVEERMLIPLAVDEVEELKEILDSSATINILYSSRYRDGKSETSLSPEERKGLQTMIKLYNKVKGEKVNGN